jgi:polyphosphate kinase
MELSTLAFNRRVLMLAENPSTPLLEKARFLSIFSANLDEFFRVRVAGFQRQIAAESGKPTMDGVSPQEQLQAIGSRARRLLDQAYQLLFHKLLPELEQNGIRVLRLAELEDAERVYLKEYYRDQVHALLTPLAVGPGHPFPHIRNLRPSLIVVAHGTQNGAEHSGIIELPGSLPRFVPLPGERRFVPLEGVIRANLAELYPGMSVAGAYTFRVSRSAVLQLDKEQVTDVLQAVEREIRRRPYRPAVRLEVDRGMPVAMRQLLLKALRKEAREQHSTLGQEDIYPVEWLIDLRGFREIASLPLPELHYPEHQHRTPIEPARPVFDLLREREVLVHFPEDSFEATVERFLVEAAEDPQVRAIKLALYRTNSSSRILEALRQASANGKQVVALLELTARFDEQKNVDWAHYLQGSGIHVVYGRPGLKIHSKIALVVRREGDDVRRYLYIGTGNLNAATASAYTDLGLLSADPELGDDLNDLFNVLTGDANHTSYRQLLVAPYNMRRRFLELIDRETAHAREGRPAHIRAKFNGLADGEMITALYRASQAGVRIELIVRGICSLRPGVVGLSDNIRVFSILGRFLEHSRIFCFANDGEPEYFIGSADWRTRNLSNRIEVAVPVRDPAHRARLDKILQEDLDNPRAWELGADGSYYQRPEIAPRGAQLSS